MYIPYFYTITLKKLNKLSKILQLSLIGTCVLLSACATQETTKETDLDPQSPEFLQTVLLKKSNEAVEAQQQYTLLIAEQRAQKEQKHSLFDEEEIDIQNFFGKPNQLLKALATRYGYEFKEIGAHKNLPNITVDEKKEKPLEVLHNISYQIDKVADVVLDKDQKTIRLVYRR